MYEGRRQLTEPGQKLQVPNRKCHGLVKLLLLRQNFLSKALRFAQFRQKSQASSAARAAPLPYKRSGVVTILSCESPPVCTARARAPRADKLNQRTTGHKARNIQHVSNEKNSVDRQHNTELRPSDCVRS